MATTTTNLGLKKPAYSDSADVKDFNDNMDTIDTAVGTINDKIANMFVQKSATFSNVAAEAGASITVDLSSEVGSKNIKLATIYNTSGHNLFTSWIESVNNTNKVVTVRCWNGRTSSVDASIAVVALCI